MGLFGKFAYSDRRWSTDGPSAVPFLLIDIHDSHVATVDFRAADASGGRFFLGYEPRFYFDEPGAGTPVDTGAEAEGFVRWVREATGTDVDPADVEQLLASPDGAPPAAETVQETIEELCTLTGLPLPDWPTDDDAPPG
ncbi:MAG: hypothetical protein JWR45_2704 [Blastococcus sp.]|jgi:hypothetical protein|nr:hypothetical protein [Blastococcus sp.]